MRSDCAAQLGSGAAGGCRRHDPGHGLETRLAKAAGIASIGGELSHPTGAALRVGGRINDDATMFSMGAGYALSAIQLDYAFVPYRLDLGDSHRISFTAQF